MCGRYFLTHPGDVLTAELGLESAVTVEARFNIAPTQQVPIVRRSARGGRELVLARWGLVPFWAKDPAIGNRLINARAESLGEKPSFRDAFRKHRCLIPASGFYEWQKKDGGKQPWVLRRPDGGPMTFAGLWSRWRDRATGDELESCAIVTTAPNEVAAAVHDRMPVILDEPARALWLDPEAEPARDLPAILAPSPPEELEAFPISLRVNNPRNDDAACLEPLAPSR